MTTITRWRENGVAGRRLGELEMIGTIKPRLAQPRMPRRKTPERNKTVTTRALLGSELILASL